MGWAYVLPFLLLLCSSVHDCDQQIGNGFRILKYLLLFVCSNVSASSFAQHDFKCTGSENIAIHDGMTHTQVSVTQECFAAGMGKRFELRIDIWIHISSNRLIHDKVNAIAA